MFASVFTEDADLVGFDGHRLQGVGEIAAFHAMLFEKWLKGTTLVGCVRSIRFITGEVAVVHAVGNTKLKPGRPPTKERISIQTLVAIIQDGRWKFAAFQNTRLRPMSESGTNALLWIFTDKLWKCAGRHPPGPGSGHDALDRASCS